MPRLRLTMTKGLPASGKTTWALEQVSQSNGQTKRVNKDELRAMIDADQWSNGNEKFILDMRDQIVESALRCNYNVIVDDTNFAPEHERTLRNLAHLWGADFAIKDFTSVPLEICLQRDSAREKLVGEKVIKDMHNKYIRTERPPQEKTVSPLYNSLLPSCIIVDVDGTVATTNGRNPFDWLKVSEDKPRLVVLQILQSFLRSNEHTKLIFVSGRDSVCLPETTSWLSRYFKDFRLFMRPQNDRRRDSVVKREIYNREIKDQYNVVAVFDDRPQVIRECWQELGFGDRIFNVGDGREF